MNLTEKDSEKMDSDKYFKIKAKLLEETFDLHKRIDNSQLKVPIKQFWTSRPLPATTKKARNRVPKVKLPPLENFPDIPCWTSVKQNYLSTEQTKLRFVPYVNDSLIVYDQHSPGQFEQQFKSRHRGEVGEQSSPLDEHKRNRTSSGFMMPNIDEPKAHDMVYSADMARNSFENIFCLKCFVYDCGRHEHSHQEQKYNYDEDMAIHGVCGKDCFLNIEDIRKELYVKQEQVVNGHDENHDDDGETAIKEANFPKFARASVRTDHWLNNEKTMINVLMDTFNGHFCRIAQTLGGKTCAEVFVIAQQLNKEFNFTPRKYKQDKIECDTKDLKEPEESEEEDATSIQNQSNCSIKRNEHPFLPCKHSSVDEKCNEKCSCGDFCEKSCNCPLSCSHRFQGCECDGECDDNLCNCFIGGRECDPDLCECTAEEIDMDSVKCTNVAIQRRLRKKLLLGQSDIKGAGCGVFLNEYASKGELIAEYCGEIITRTEAERRGTVYDKQKCNYMFAINSEFTIDATRMGNKIRFANHSTNPNCYAKVKLVNGDHRIGFYASCDIERFEELTFNYLAKDEHDFGDTEASLTED